MNRWTCYHDPQCETQEAHSARLLFIRTRDAAIARLTRERDEAREALQAEKNETAWLRGTLDETRDLLAYERSEVERYRAFARKALRWGPSVVS